MYGIPYRTPGLDERFRLKKEDYLNENGGIIFPNPNAPTGLMENLDTIEEIVAKNPDSVVIVDEAYVDFGGVSACLLWISMKICSSCRRFEIARTCGYENRLCNRPKEADFLFK